MFKILSMTYCPKTHSVIVKLSGIDPDNKTDSVTREERKKLERLLKEFSLEIKSLDGFEMRLLLLAGLISINRSKNNEIKINR